MLISALFRVVLLFWGLLRTVGTSDDATCVGAAWLEEAQALAHLQTTAAAPRLDEELELLRLFVQRSWWEAARRLVTLSHGRGSGASAELQKELRALLTGVKGKADEFQLSATETYRGQTAGLVEVHCALQWAQNSSAIFLGVKYAARWSAPGAIEVADVQVNVTPGGFVLNGFGHHSSIRKRYVVNLDLLADILPTPSSWSSSSVGRFTATLHKATPGRWPRLIKSKDKPRYQVNKWLDMDEKWASELNKYMGALAEKNRPKTTTTTTNKAVKKPPTKDWHARLKLLKSNMQKTSRKYFNQIKAGKFPPPLIPLIPLLLALVPLAFFLCTKAPPSNVSCEAASRLAVVAAAEQRQSAEAEHPVASNQARAGEDDDTRGCCPQRKGNGKAE